MSHEITYNTVNEECRWSETLQRNKGDAPFKERMCEELVKVERKVSVVSK